MKQSRYLRYMWGKVIFDGNDDLIINTCICEDNPIKESEGI